MIQPVIHDYLTQVFVKHYKLEPRAAAEEALRFAEILELYGMQIIVGEWTIPEPAEPLSPTQAMEATWRETLEREPWNAPELKN